MKCHKCNSEIANDSLFCSECGARVSGFPTETAEEKKRRKNANAAWILTGIFGGAIIIGAAIIWSANQGEKIPENVENERKFTVLTETQSETQESEDLSLYENAVDAVNSDALSFEGILKQYGLDYALYMEEESYAICAYDQSDQVKRLENISEIELSLEEAGDQDFFIENQENRVRIHGSVRIRGETAVLKAREMEVLEVMPKEEDIHTYKIVQEDCTWSEAFQRCSEMGGYLARINSAKEFYHITALIEKEGKEKLQFYIGARRDVGSEAYYLVDEKNEFMGEKLAHGSEWCASLWLEGEPSYRDEDLKLEEEFISMFRYSKTNKWVWNDVPEDLIGALSSNKGRVGYICEMENEN